MKKNSGSDVSYPNREIGQILVSSGILGLVLGFYYSTWQEAVEYGQVIAGIIPYSPHSIFQAIQPRIWSITSQGLSLFLQAGISEKILSIGISSLLGVIIFQAVSIATFAVSRNVILATIAPLVIFILKLTEYMTIYPVRLFGYPNTHGILGLSFVFLAIAFASIGKFKISNLLVGLSPAIHVAYALQCWVIFIFLYATDKDCRENIKKAFPYLIAGLGISSVSYCVFLIFNYSHGGFSSVEDTSKYMYAFIESWDAHRRPVNFFSKDFGSIIAGLILAISYFPAHKLSMGRSGKILCVSILISGIIGTFFSVLTYLPPQKVPLWFSILIPARWVNITILGYPVLLFALWSEGFVRKYLLAFFLFLGYFIIPNLTFEWMTFTTVCLLLLTNSKVKEKKRILGLVILISNILWVFSPNGIGLVIPDTSIVGVVLYITRLAFILGMVLTGITLLSNISLSIKYPRQTIYHYIPDMLIVVFTLLAFSVLFRTIKPQQEGYFNDRTNSPVFSLASTRPGVLLTSSNLSYIQLRTRRPVLLDGGRLDIFPYAPEVAPSLNNTLDMIYRVDILHPSEEIKRIRPGGLLTDTGKLLWEQRTKEQWYDIAKKYGITDIITYADWKLQLPLLARDNLYSLYAIQ